MSLRKRGFAWIVSCDAPGCGATHDAGMVSSGVLGRYSALQAGWHHFVATPGIRCPECSAAMIAAGCGVAS